MELRVLELTCLFVWKSLGSSDQLLKAVFNTVRNDDDYAWSKSVSRFIDLIGAHHFAGRKAQLNRELTNHSVVNKLSMK